MIRLPWLVSVAGSDVCNPPPCVVSSYLWWRHFLLAGCVYASVNFVLPVRIADCLPPQSVSEDNLVYSSVLTHWMAFC